MSQKSPKKSRESTPYQSSEELYQALFEQAAEGIFIADKQGRYIEVNQRGCEMLGYSRAELLSLTMKDLLPKADQTRDPPLLDELRAGNTILKERHLRCKDGRLLPVEISARMLANGHFLGMVRDISKRKQAEEQLRESNERFRLLAESSLTGIYLIQDNRFRYVNPAMAQIFGYQVEEIVDKLGPMGLVYSDDQTLVAENIRRRVEGEEEALHYDFRGMRKDGSVIHVEVHGRRIEYGGKTGVIGTLADITKRKQAEEALRASEEQLQMALDAAQMGQWSWNIAADEVTWSPQCLALYGLPPDTQMNYERFLQALHPDDRKHIDQALRRAVEERAGYDEQKRTIWPDGSTYWTASRGKVYYDDTDRPVRMVGVSFDITKWKEAEKEHQTHLWFLESLDQINQAMQGISDIEQMMSNVLDTMLSIFDCDRAWLVYPCDPEAAKWQVQMERTRPEYPGVLPIGVELPLDPMGTAVFTTLREAHGPVQFGPEAEHQVPVEMAERFSLQSFIAMALYPKVGQPWSFGLHQCGYPRAWTPEEERLFQEIGRRLADSLTSLLAYRNLRESERKLAEAERIAHIGWWDRDYVADSITLSDEACRIFGLPFEEQGHDLDRWHKQWQALIHPDDRPGAAQAASAALQHGPRYDVEYRVIHRDGEERFVRSQGDVTWDDSGQPQRMFGIMQDITELRHIEDELRHNREAALHFSKQLATLQEVTNQLSKAESSDDLCRQAVQFGRSDLGFDRVSIWFIEEDLGLMRGSFGTDEHGQLRDERNARIKFRHRGLAWQVFSQKESNALVKHQKLYNHEGQKVGEGDNAIAALWNGDEVIGIISVDNLSSQHPISKHQLEVLRLYATTLGHLIRRKRVEESLRQHQVQLQHVVNTVPAGVLLLDAHGRIYLMNPVAEQYLAVLVPDWADGHLTHLGQRPLNELFTSPEESLWHEITVDNLIFEAIACPVENSPKNGGWVLIVRDITQERDFQQRVQRQERLAAVGQLAAGIAHDFNNILAVIALYTQLISRTVEMPARIQERLHTIEQQIKRATDLIQQILDFSRQSVLERQPVDLLPFMEKLATLLERTLPENIHVELEHDAEAYFIQADPSRIQQVVMNLAVNARDAMPDGGHLKIGLAHVQTEKPKPMPVQDLPPGDWVQIEVADSGEGIPQEALSHIFEPFFTTKQVGEGTGLGLAQVYGIVQQHEGYIDITTEVGQGTTFFLYFPALNIGTSPMEIVERGELQSGQGQRILLVEDDHTTREALLDSLAQLNYEVLATTNGREALTFLAAKANEIDLVLSDVVMPEMGGTALFHAMQEQNLTIPIVLLTGHPLSKEMENLQKRGLAGWLPKPPDLVNLSNLLAKLLAD
ncbi:MAG: hypothetical protein CL608_28220 [Anaerolineaceae bacterium]|nr:hypothetical protein [Anaerolineaceae bacterium]